MQSASPAATQAFGRSRRISHARMLAQIGIE